MDTLVRDPFRDVMPSFFGMTLTEMMAQKRPDAWARFERGELTETEFLSSFFADGRRFDHSRFCTAIRDAYGWIDGMQALLASLKQRGYAMHVLSNYPVWFRWIEERLSLSRYVEWSFMSCRLGLRKPDVAIFQRVVGELGIAAAECVLVDDRLRNCEAARAAGLQAVHFEGNALELVRKLEPLLLLQQEPGK